MVDSRKYLPRLKGIFGNDTAEIVLLHIHELGEAWAQMIADDYGIALTPVKKQLIRFEGSGILKKTVRGRTIIYSYNDDCPQTPHVRAIIASAIDQFSRHQTKVFSRRKKSLGTQEGVEL